MLSILAPWSLPMPIKLHDNKAWLTRQYVTLKQTPAQIAQTAGCSTQTIYRRLTEAGLIKK